LVWFGLVGLFCFGLVWFGLVWFGFVWFGLVLFCWVNVVWFGLVGLVWFGLLWPAYEHHGGAVGVPLAPVLFAHPEDGGSPAETTNYAMTNYANSNLYNL
jgi:hypothetical protein